MHTIDIIDDRFPHGTPRGFAEGCRGAGCPALISCRDIRTRYAGDWNFKRLIDAGTPLEVIVARDQAERDGIRERDRAATRADRRAEEPHSQRARRRTVSRKPSATRSRHEVRTTAPTAQHTPTTAPAADPETASSKPHAGYSWLSEAQTQTAALNAEQAATWQQALAEYRVALDAHVAALTSWVDEHRRCRDALRTAAKMLEQTRIAQSTGITLNGVIAAAFDAALVEHDQARAALQEHSASPRPKAPTRPRRPRLSPAKGTGAPRELKPHGTNACRARGCERPECVEAGRQYHREWMAERQRKDIQANHHGTAYGYQLGCKDRATCPATISCAEASLNEERRRARQAGVPEQAPRVPADPVRAHVRALMASGMTILTIAADAQVSKTGIKILLYGRSGARKGELPAAIEQTKAEQIMQLAPSRHTSSRTA